MLGAATAKLREVRCCRQSLQFRQLGIGATLFATIISHLNLVPRRVTVDVPIAQSPGAIRVWGDSVFPDLRGVESRGPRCRGARNGDRNIFGAHSAWSSQRRRLKFVLRRSFARRTTGREGRQFRPVRYWTYFSRSGQVAQRSAVVASLLSTIAAVAPLVLTDWMPFSIAALPSTSSPDGQPFRLEHKIRAAIPGDLALEHVVFGLNWSDRT